MTLLRSLQAGKAVGAERLVAVQLVPEPAQERLTAAVVVLDRFEQLVAWQLAAVLHFIPDTRWGTRPRSLDSQGKSGLRKITRNLRRRNLRLHMFEANNSEYGYRRTCAALARGGEWASSELGCGGSGAATGAEWTGVLTGLAWPAQTRSPQHRPRHRRRCDRVLDREMLQHVEPADALHGPPNWRRAACVRHRLPGSPLPAAPYRWATCVATRSVCAAQTG